MELQYAPPAKRPTRLVPVILAGLLTTALTLLGVYLLEANYQTNVMGFHANYVIPIGAIGVGLLASSGYGLASYITGLKIRKGLLWMILLLQVLAYFAAQYVTFASQGPLIVRGTSHRITFPEYFDLVARNFAWKDEHSNKTGEALGEWGYLFIGLEIAGFALGSLIVPLVLMKHPYCELCQMYMKRKRLATLPASVRNRKISKKDPAAVAAYQAEQDAALAGGRARVQELAKFAETGDVNGFAECVAELKTVQKAAAKLPARITVTLVRCRGCNGGHLQASLARGQGNKSITTPLGRFELEPQFIAALMHPLGAVGVARPMSSTARA